MPCNRFFVIIPALHTWLVVPFDYGVIRTANYAMAGLYVSLNLIHVRPHSNVATIAGRKPRVTFVWAAEYIPA
jgi:hypothetical protein